MWILRLSKTSYHYRELESSSNSISIFSKWANLVWYMFNQVDYKLYLYPSHIPLLDCKINIVYMNLNNTITFDTESFGYSKDSIPKDEDYDNDYPLDIDLVLNKYLIQNIINIFKQYIISMTHIIKLGDIYESTKNNNPNLLNDF